ncbi:hypothetical protein XANCAGTX0491_007234 [Xanthoria calcicola]
MDDRQSSLSSERDVGAKPSQSGQGTDQLNASPSTDPDGVGLGPIDPRFLARKTWPLDTPERISQYHKFVRLMINRIRAGESNDADSKLFTDLIDHPDDRQYILSTSGMLPELDEPGPLATNPQMTMLVGHIKNILDVEEKERIRRMGEDPPQHPTAPQTAEAIAADKREKVAKLLFGPKGESNATPAMKRLLTSWVSMGYPGEALEIIMDQDSKRGRGQVRDKIGLPHGLRERRSRSRYPNRAAQKDIAPVLRATSRNALHRCQPLRSGHPSSAEDAEVAKKVSRRLTKPAPSTLQQSQPSPPDTTSSIEPVGFTKKNAHGTYVPGDSDSPPTSDDPPDDLLWEVTESDHDSVDEPEATTTGAPRVSFWDFVSTHSPDYREDIGPLPRKLHCNAHVESTRPASVSTRVTHDGTVVTEGFARPKPEISDAILKEIDSTQVKYQRMVDVYQEAMVAKRRQETEEARKKKHATEEARHKKELAASVNGENGCAIEDTTSESEREIEIRKKTKTPRSHRTSTLLQSNSSTGPPTLTLSSSLKATRTGISKGVNLEQVNRILQDSGGITQESSIDGVRASSHVSSKAPWLDYLKSTAEYAKERANADGIFGPGGIVNGY